MKIDKNSYGTIALSWLISAALTLLILKTIGMNTVGYTISVLVLLFSVFVTWFHRVPVRHTPEGDRIVTSGADGKVVIIKRSMRKNT